MAIKTPSFSSFLSEASKFAALQANKEPLSDKEREKAMKANAVWHKGNHKGKPSCAIWKSKDSQGNTVFVCNTHRAFAVEKSLDAAIRKFHSFVKETG